MKSEHSLGEALARDEYLRLRLKPRRRDQDYLHFVDLRDFVFSRAKVASGRLFDFGCGGAPYRDFFTHCTAYTGADIQAGPSVDVVLGQGFITGASDGSYDTVLSTQVLEHVADPDAYVREAARILKPGGMLILTTHGMGEEHGCPWDFHRWTGTGLENLVKRCGFQDVQCSKLTCGVRGSLLLINQMMTHLRTSRSRQLWLPLALVRKIHARAGVPFCNWLADRFPELGIVPSSSSENLYAGIAVTARKR